MLIFIFLPILTCPLLVVFEEDLESELNPKKIGEFGKWILTNLMLPDVSIKSLYSRSRNAKVGNVRI